MVDASVRRIALLCLLFGALPACGKKGPLYLPEAAGEVVTRPAATPPDAESTTAPNSPQTPDSQPAAPPPAPEVSAPDPDKKDPKKEEPKTGGATAPPPQ